jgi:hypothetical protein
MAHAANGGAANASSLNACRWGDVGGKVHMRMVDAGENPRRPGETGGWNKRCGTENGNYRHGRLFVAEGRKCEDRFAREHLLSPVYLLSGCISLHADWSWSSHRAFIKVPASGWQTLFL